MEKKPLISIKQLFAIQVEIVWFFNCISSKSSIFDHSEPRGVLKYINIHIKSRKIYKYLLIRFSNRLARGVWAKWTCPLRCGCRPLPIHYIENQFEIISGHDEGRRSAAPAAAGVMGQVLMYKTYIWTCVLIKLALSKIQKTG